MKCIWLLGLTYGFNLLGAEPDYPLGPDSKAQAVVPKGEVIKGVFEGSKIFPGTTREYWVYRPQQFDASKAACVMIFQDGIQYNAPVVFDNLIHKKEIPPVIGLFIMHGRVKAHDTNALDRFNRSYEYDSVNDNYARFLLEEFLPYVASEHNLNLSTNGNDRAIAGNSSGAICAFTAAWERPEAFSRVFSAIGTYVGLRGGNDYPTLIRKTEPKPIRVFLQDGRNDLDIYGGNWWIANLDMLSALKFSGYEVNHVWGEGGHNSKHATAIFPDALRWLWKDWPRTVSRPWKRGPSQPSTNRVLIPPVTTILLENEEWRTVSSGHKFTEGPCVNSKGEVFFADIPNNRIHKIGLDGNLSAFAENTGGANGLEFDSGGKLHACQGQKNRVVTYDEGGIESSITEDGAAPNDLCITRADTVYYTVPSSKMVKMVKPGTEARVVDRGIDFPNGLCLSPDQSLLLVADTRGRFVYSFQIQPDGSLTNKQKYFHLHLADGSTQSGADGMTVDANGNLYVTTELGIQVCDQAGRVNSIISKPQRTWLSNVSFGGKDLDTLYVTCGDKVYARKTKVRGVSPSLPVKPPTPRL